MIFENNTLTDEQISGFQNEVANKNIHASDNGDLVMLKYSRPAVYNQVWNEWTMTARGLLLSSDYRTVLARGFSKFFNVGEYERLSLPALPVHLPVRTVTKKLDGSLGLISTINGQNRIFTAGSSLESDITRKGMELLRNIVDSKWSVPAGYTVLVEIISSVNPIVVDYGGREFLSALAVMNNSTGETVSYSEIGNYWPGEITPLVAENIDFQDALSLTVPDDEEGYVFEFSDGTRAKVKGEEYIRLHRLYSQLSYGSLVADLKANRVQEVAGKIPNKHARDIYETAAKKVTEEANAVISEVQDKIRAHGLDKVQDRREFAIGAKELLTGKDFTIAMMGFLGKSDSALEAAVGLLPYDGQTSLISFTTNETTFAGDDSDDF